MRTRMMNNSFAVIVNSHGRSDFPAYNTLRKSGYTGKIFITIDDEDDSVNEYISKYGKETVHLFHKDNDGEYDVGDNFDSPMGVVVFARNEAWKCAKEHGVEFFFVMDDDLQSVNFRYTQEDSLKSKKAYDLDECFDALCDFMHDNDRVYCMGFGLSNDYIGGFQRFEENFGKKRLIMNGYLCCTQRHFPFNGRICEDSIVSIDQAVKGNLFLNCTQIMTVYDIWMPNKEHGNGGMQDTYKKMSSYAMRNYALMRHPSCVKIKSVDGGFDTGIEQRHAYPCVVSGRYRKP